MSRAIALGTFDGVHRGHRAVIDAAAASGLATTVVTFHPHPRTVLGNRVELLTTVERRLDLLTEAGAADVVVVEFTPDLSELEPADVAERYLPAIDARIVVAGERVKIGHTLSGA